MRFPSRMAFDSWLRHKKSGDVVGFPSRSCECPIATYLREHGAKSPYVRPDIKFRSSCWRPDHSIIRHLPEWANKFAYTVDNEIHRDDVVYASVALAILDRCP